MKLKAFFGFKSTLIRPCSKMGSKILSIFVFRFHRPSFSSIKPPRFRISRRSRFMRRTKVVRFRKPFSIKSIHLPRCRPKTKLRLRLRKSPMSSTKRSLRLRFRKKNRRAPPTTTTTTSTTPTVSSTPVAMTTGVAGAGAGTGASPVVKGGVVVTAGGERFGEKIAELLSVFKSVRRSSNELAVVDPRKSVSDLETTTVSTDGDAVSNINNSNVINNDGNSSTSCTENGKDEVEPLPSPITPAYVRKRSSDETIKDDVVRDDDRVKVDINDDEVDEVEDVCKRFESYLAEMIVEEGKVKDLMDVEELLNCWKSLKSPLFLDLVCRFYGEMCKDLYSPVEHEDDDDEEEDDDYEEENERTKLI